MSNWLTAVIVLLIVVILADGFRRTWNNRRNRIGVSPALSKRMKNSSSYDDVKEPPPSYISELPNGGARVVAVRDPVEAQERQKQLTAREKRELHREEIAKRQPEQTRLNLDASVPILMESVDHHDDEESISEHHNGRIDPTFSATDSEHDDQDDEEYDQEDYDDDEYDYEEDDEYDEEDDDEEELASSPASGPQSDPEEVLIINIMATKGSVFNGSELLDIVLKCGLRYGSMDIFHRYADVKGEGALLFSMANMVKPGTFDLDAMDDFTTPGVSLFMTLPIEADSLPSFDLMVETAQAISQTLQGELKDEQRSAMTRQTLEHSRQRIRDFERKKLFRRPR